MTVLEAREKIGRMVTIVRMAAGYSLAEAAEIAGVPPYVLSLWERGEAPPTTREKMLAFIDERYPPLPGESAAGA